MNNVYRMLSKFGYLLGYALCIAAVVIFLFGCEDIGNTITKHLLRKSERMKEIDHSMRYSINLFEQAEANQKEAPWEKPLLETISLIFKNNDLEMNAYFLEEFTRALPDLKARSEWSPTNRAALERIFEKLNKELATPIQKVKLENEAIARIKCLAQIGTPDALKLLQSFHKETRSLVIDELAELIDPLEIDIVLEQFSKNFWSEQDNTSPYLSGTVRENIRDISKLATLKEIHTLDLRNTQVKDLTPLTKLPKLESIDLSNTPIEDIAPLGSVKNLHCLMIPSTAVRDLSPLRAAKELKFLTLCGSDVTDLSPLADLRALETLQADGGCGRIQRRNPLINNLKNISVLAGIKTLNNLSIACTKVENEDLAAFKDHSFKIFTASNTPISDISFLKNSPDLETLDLRDTQVRDLSPLRNLHKLKELKLSATQVNDLTPLNNLTSIKELALNRTPIYSLAGLEKLENLETLWLMKTQVRDLSPLRNLHKLKELRLDETHVQSLTPLSQLTELEEISLSKTRVGSLAGLEKLQKLQRLTLTDTEVKDVSALAQLKSLRTLHVDDRSALAEKARAIRPDLFNRE